MNPSDSPFRLPGDPGESASPDIRQSFPPLPVKGFAGASPGRETGNELRPESKQRGFRVTGLGDAVPEGGAKPAPVAAPISMPVEACAIEPGKAEADGDSGVRRSLSVDGPVEALTEASSTTSLPPGLPRPTAVDSAAEEGIDLLRLPGNGFSLWTACCGDSAEFVAAGDAPLQLPGEAFTVWLPDRQLVLTAGLGFTVWLPGQPFSQAQADSAKVFPAEETLAANAVEGPEARKPPGAVEPAAPVQEVAARPIETVQVFAGAGDVAEQLEMGSAELRPRRKGGGANLLRWAALFFLVAVGVTFFTLRAELQDVRGELTRQAGEIRQLSGESRQLESRLQDRAERNRQLLADVDRLEELLDETRGSLDSMTRARNVLTVQLEELEVSLRTAAARHELEKTALQSRVADLDSANSTLHSDIEAQGRVLAEVQATLAAAGQELKARDQRIAGLESERDRLASQGQEDDQRIAALESALDGVRRAMVRGEEVSAMEFAALGAENGVLRRALNGEIDAVLGWRQQGRTSELRLAALTRERDELAPRLGSAPDAGELAGLRRQLNEVESANAALRASLETGQVKLTGLEVSLQEAAQKLQTATADRESLREENSALVAQVDSLNRDLDAVESRNSEEKTFLRRRIVALSTENRRLTDAARTENAVRLEAASQDKTPTEDREEPEAVKDEDEKEEEPDVRDVDDPGFPPQALLRENEELRETVVTLEGAVRAVLAEGEERLSSGRQETMTLRQEGAQLGQMLRDRTSRIAALQTELETARTQLEEASRAAALVNDLREEAGHLRRQVGELESGVQEREDRIAFLDVEYASLRRTALELQELLSREHEVNEELAEYVGKLRGEV
ncbi:MAG TPA: hypothetical protein VMN36_18610, partial [Verrucomicrobiales bacterium]|nr:hypothetical protein [Verrucomicrobiales bacterium]